MKYEAGIVHESGAVHAVQVAGGIEIRVLSGASVYGCGVHPGNPDDPALIAKARTTVDRLARYPDAVRRLCN